MGRTACTESQCLYRVSVPVQSLSACTESQCLYKGALYIRTRNILFIVHKSLSKCAVPSRCNHHHHHHHHISVMELGHLLTRSGLTCPEVFSKVCQIKLYILLLCKYQYVVWADKSAVTSSANSVWGCDNLSWKQFVVYTKIIKTKYFVYFTCLHKNNKNKVLCLLYVFKIM